MQHMTFGLYYQTRPCWFQDHILVISGYCVNNRNVTMFRDIFQAILNNFF